MKLSTTMRRLVSLLRLSFAGVIESAADYWEDRGEPDSWSPRQVVEHVLAAELAYTGAIASAVGADRPAWEQFDLASPKEALAALDDVAATCRPVLRKVGDKELSRLVPSGATPLEVMNKDLAHLAEHAGQINQIIWTERAKRNSRP